MKTASQLPNLFRPEGIILKYNQNLRRLMVDFIIVAHVIANIEVLKIFLFLWAIIEINGAVKNSAFFVPTIIISVPSGITEMCLFFLFQPE